MNINPTVGAQPSFQAKIKRNEAFNKFTENMGANQYKEFNKLLCKLGNVSKGDVLEIYETKEPKKNPKDNDYTTFFIHNPKKKHSDIELDSGYRYGNNVVPDKLIDVIEKVLEPKTKETKTLLTEPARKGKTIFQRLSDFFSVDGCDDDPTCYRY